MRLSRASGILLHPTSLPGPYGIGDIGPLARRFVDWLASSGQHWWEVLPLGPTGNAHSPFSAYSELAGNPLLVSPQELLRDGLLHEKDAIAFPEVLPGRVDFDVVTVKKMRILRTSFEWFWNQQHHPAARAHFHTFLSEHTWVRRYALFMALKSSFHEKPWWQWPAELRSADPQAIRAAERVQQDAILFHEYLQWQFSVQWQRLRTYAEHRSIQLIGNLAYYPAHDSVDVWANQNYFSLDAATGKATAVAGVPPDYFNANGQLWGMPTYHWGRIRENEWDMVIERVAHLLQNVDLIKLDHFRGYQSYWEIPTPARTARAGSWQPGPGAALFTTLRKRFKTLPLIVEDLGVMTKDVEELRDQFMLHGLRVLAFGLESMDDKSYHMPGQYPERAIAYTGTHDNNTFRGWFQTRKLYGKTAREVARIHSFALRHLHADKKSVTPHAVSAVLRSKANLAIIPMQDLLDLPGTARLNTPGTRKHNWEWRLTGHELTDALKEHLYMETKKAER